MWNKLLAPIQNFWRGGNSANPAYRSARVTKLNDDWQPQNISGNLAVAESWDVMTGRVRDLFRNDPVLRKALHMAETLVIGGGIQTFSEATEPGGEYFDAFADESDTQFERWMEGECDITGRMTLVDMQRMSFRDMWSTGFSGWLKVINSDGNRSSPLAYQLFEAEQLDRTKDRPAAPGRTRIIHGIELNRFNAPIAAWLYDAHPMDYHAGGFQLRSTRIPISRLILNVMPDRVSAHMGAAELNCLVQVSRDRDKLVSNELTTRAVRALMTLFFFRENPSGALTDALNALDSDTEQSKATMGYPAIVEAERGDSAEVLQSGQGGEDMSTFVNLLTDLSAMGTRFSRHRLTGSAAEANMASIRAGHNDDERVIDPLQKNQAFRVAIPVRREHTRLQALFGLMSSVRPSEFQSQQQRLQVFSWVTAGSPDFEPKEDSEAAINRIRSGRSTPQIEAARLGFNWRKISRDMKRYLDFNEKLGLGFPDWSKGAGAGFHAWVPLDKQPSLQGQGNAEDPEPVSVS